MAGVRWTEKYRPHALKEVLGNSKAVSELRGWAESWASGLPDMRGVILYGTAGIGKTSAALALAEEMGWDHIELNASDQRTASVIEKVAGSASRMSTFSGSKRLIILDEADNLHGNADRGGMAAMLRLVKDTNQPVILIANEYYQIAKPLRDACLGIRFRSIRATTVASLLRSICKRESILCEPEVIERIAEMSGGDLRSAVNDLQAVAEGMIEVRIGDVATAVRDSKSSIFEALGKIFRGSSVKDALEVSYSLDENPEDLVHWIDENLPAVFEGEDLERGFDTLSRADVYLGRVRRRQNYGLWRYAGFMMTGGILGSRTQRKGGYISFRPPSLWRRLGQTKKARNVRDSAALKIGRHCHVSARYARMELMDFVGMLLKNKLHAPKVAALLDLNDEEIALLMGSRPTTKKVSNIYEEAQRLREAEVIEEIEFAWKGAGAPLAKAAPLVSKEPEENATQVEIRLEKKTAPAGVPADKKKKQKSLFDF
jgi:replication factor C large subunit